ncbi:hypothetical protein UFOVP1119_46 [uncultured Caudovirales phage]|uniref:Uncharacterized protein n=1 Tax=uncultured Caudovirales phage TaxID=2100421 RepID=A0A6J5R813_9CAUD|nr:hypothetical protein UFOVP1119_46 [uncultured Caudovirales phage]CAB4193113.1 hypothetical protein UFOVP1238_20 [uncultured Caudovirales phage]
MKKYPFVIRLEGAVMANSEKEAHEKINLHLNDLGDVDSERYDLNWPDVSWDMEYDLC